MSDHSEVLRRVLVWDWPHDAEVRKTTEALTLVADVLDAIPDKDDPLGWVQEVRVKRMGVPTPSEALQMQVTINRELQAEIDELRALRGVIPGDDKQLVAEWALTLAREYVKDPRHSYDLHYLVRGEWKACPPSVRAALTQSKGD